MDYVLCLSVMPTEYYHPVYQFVSFVHVSVRASVQLEMHSPGNTNTITDVRALKCTTFFSYLNFYHYFI